MAFGHTNTPTQEPVDGIRHLEPPNNNAEFDNPEVTTLNNFQNGPDNSSSQPGKTKKTLIILSVSTFSLLLIFSGAYLYFQNQKPTNLQQDYLSESLQEQLAIEDAGSRTESIIECSEEDWGCFIQASKDCHPAIMVSQSSTDIFGVINTSKSTMEIKGYDMAKCNFYMRLDQVDLSFPEGVSEDIVLEQNQIYQMLEGRDGLCKFDPKELTDLLTNWSLGNYSSGRVSCALSPEANDCTTVGGDFGNAECEGSFFSNTL